jgi:flagellar basal-body rod protein FlgG
MIRALFSAASGMNAQQLNVDNIAHNLANSSTTGFKQSRTQFQDLLYQHIIQPGTAAGSQTTVPTGLQVGLGVRPSSNEVVFTQGSFASTDNPLDLVIQGKGFFQVQMPTGDISYTRAGNFSLDRDGNIVTSDGNPVLPQITIPPQAQDINIALDGTVSYTVVGQTAAQKAGQILIATFPNPGGLSSVGSSLFTQTDSSGAPTVAPPGGQEGAGTLLQGYLEQSNVSIVDEFVNMIVAQRTYEANSKVVKTADEMYQQVNNLVQ